MYDCKVSVKDVFQEIKKRLRASSKHLRLNLSNRFLSAKFGKGKKTLDVNVAKRKGFKTYTVIKFFGLNLKSIFLL